VGIWIDSKEIVEDGNARESSTISIALSRESIFYNSISLSILLKSPSNSFDLCPVSSTKVIFKDNFLNFFKVQFSFSGSTIFLKSFSISFGHTAFFLYLGSKVNLNSCIL